MVTNAEAIRMLTMVASEYDVFDGAWSQCVVESIKLAIDALNNEQVSETTMEWSKSTIKNCCYNTLNK